MPTAVHVQTKGNPFCVRDEWYFTDEQGRAHGPYASLGRATIGFGKYIRDHIEGDPPRYGVWALMIGVLIIAGYVLTHH